MVRSAKEQALTLAQLSKLKKRYHDISNQFNCNPIPYLSKKLDEAAQSESLNPILSVRKSKFYRLIFRLLISLFSTH